MITDEVVDFVAVQRHVRLHVLFTGCMEEELTGLHVQLMSAVVGAPQAARSISSKRSKVGYHVLLVARQTSISQWIRPMLIGPLVLLLLQCFAQLEL